MAWQLEWEQRTVKALGDLNSTAPEVAQVVIRLALAAADDPYSQSSADTAVSGIRTLTRGRIYVVYRLVPARDVVQVIGLGTLP